MPGPRRHIERAPADAVEHPATDQLKMGRGPPTLPHSRLAADSGGLSPGWVASRGILQSFQDGPDGDEGLVRCRREASRKTRR